MRVIEDTPDPRAIRRSYCPNCGVTLEYTRNDTRREFRRDYSGGCDSYTVITCPNCNKSFDVAFF